VGGVGCWARQRLKEPLGPPSAAVLATVPLLGHVVPVSCHGPGWRPVHCTGLRAVPARARCRPCRAAHGPCQKAVPPAHGPSGNLYSRCGGAKVLREEPFPPVEITRAIIVLTMLKRPRPTHMMFIMQNKGLCMMPKPYKIP
jgi:hypothetical protein